MASIQKRILKNGETAFRVQVRLKGYRQTSPDTREHTFNWMLSGGSNSIRV